MDPDVFVIDILAQVVRQHVNPVASFRQRPDDVVDGYGGASLAVVRLW